MKEASGDRDDEGGNGRKRGPKETLPVGTIVVRGRVKEGDRRRRALMARFIKVRNGGRRSGRWMLYARWWWETNRGPVPKGQMVLHADMDTMNDDPDNLILGDASTKLLLCHKLDPEMSRRNRMACKAGTSEFNRLNGKLHRLREVLQNHYYPVLDDLGVILNVPFRRMPDLLRWFGADTREVPKNWRGPKVKKAAESIPVRSVLGSDLLKGILPSYARIDLEWEIAAGAGQMSQQEVEDRIKLLKKHPVWTRALEAARLDNGERSGLKLV